MRKYPLLSLIGIFCLLLSLLPQIHAESVSFKDIGNTHRAKNEIYYLAEGKIVTGTTDGNYQPDRNVTRAEAAAMIGRAIQLNGQQVETSFKDVGKSNFASGYIQEAAKKNIINGYKDGTFKPNDNVTRGEMALLISRAFGYGNTSTAVSAQQLIKLGIAQGLANGSFGESQNIKRSDFAVFLARAINADLRQSGQKVTFDKKFQVNADLLNFRTGPSTSYSAVDQLKQNQEVMVAYYVGDWAYIQSGTEKGFVNKSYLTSVDSSSDDDNTDTNPISSKTIVIDPGHGSPDNGASGFGLKEKDVVLDTGLRVKKYLSQTPFNVQLTRETDKKIELADRVAFAKKVNADIFVSIHANAGGGTGTETYYYSAASTNPNVAQSKALATYINNRMVAAWNLTNRGVKVGDLHVLRENSMPACLVELGFIDNSKDNALLASATWRDKAAQAIYLGILDYYYHYEKLNVLSLYDLVGGKPSAK